MILSLHQSRDNLGARPSVTPHDEPAASWPRHVLTGWRPSGDLRAKGDGARTSGVATGLLGR